MGYHQPNRGYFPRKRGASRAWQCCVWSRRLRRCQVKRNTQKRCSQLLPPGKAWPRGADAVLTGVLRAWAGEWARVDARVAQCLAEALPSYADELLAEWEGVLGLETSTASVPLRQARLVQRLSKGRALNDESLGALANSLGWRLTFAYFTPLKAAHGTYRGKASQPKLGAC